MLKELTMMVKVRFRTSFGCHARDHQNRKNDDLEPYGKEFLGQRQDQICQKICSRLDIDWLVAIVSVGTKAVDDPLPHADGVLDDMQVAHHGGWAWMNYEFP